MQECGQWETIVAGPSKFDLMLGLFDGNHSHPRPVVLKCEGNNGVTIDLEVEIESISRQTDVDENWEIEGWVNDPRYPSLRECTVYFSTRIRFGAIRFLV